MSARAELLPFYVVCDVSASMREGDRISALNDVIRTVVDTVSLNPVIADRTRVGILDFASEVVEQLPLCDPSYVDQVPALEPRGLTSYRGVFDRLCLIIRRDVATLVADGYRVFRPAVFFFTDGEPTDRLDDWVASLDRLLDPAFPHRPNIVAFGFGEARPETLTRIGVTRAYLATDPAAAASAIAEFGSLLVSSVVGSGRSGRFEAPAAASPGLEILVGDLV